jgi:hypothetical protein
MSDSSTPKGGASALHYIGWRTELLAKLALSRLPGITVTERPLKGKFAFSVMTSTGFSFLLEVKGISSMREKIRDIETVSELRWRVQTALLKRLKTMRCPVVLFLFDADTEHGRYLRIDNLRLVAAAVQTQSIRIPLENVINTEGLHRMLKDLEADSKK